MFQQHLFLIYGKESVVSTVRLFGQTDALLATLTPLGIGITCILFIVYTMYCSGCFCKTRPRNEVGDWSSGISMCDCMGDGIFGLFGWSFVYLERVMAKINLSCGC